MTRTKKLLLCGLALAILLPVAAWLGRPAYRHYKESRSLRQARAFLKTGDLHNAQFCLRQTLAINSTNIEALVMMANIHSEARSPGALPLRQRAAELAPTTENKLLLAATALQFERPPFPIATQTLAELQPIATTNVSWHLISSQLALRRNQISEAESHLQAAAKLEPTNRLHQLNLAVIHLQAGGDKAVQAREQLSTFTTDPVLGEHALRSLIADCILNRQFTDAKRFSDKLLALPQAQFGDRLQQLTILNELASPDMVRSLANVESEASTNLLYSLRTADWLLSHQGPKPTRDWVLSLAPEIRGTFPMPLVIVESYAKTNDWRGLEKWLTTERWNNEDFLRFAWLARAAREQKVKEMGDIYWRRASSAAEGSVESSATLAQLTAAWNWNDEMEESLRTVVRLDPRQNWAWDALLKRRTAAGDTTALFQLYSTMLEHNTNSVILKNNLAALALLLNRNTNQAFQLSKEVYEAQTNSPEFASTRAFALYRQNKAAEGLQILRPFPENQLSRPEIALYYALLLSANNQRESAAPYIAAAKKGQLLPEERQLLERISSAN